MKLIIGLGNPGPKYKSTRHNAGFMVLDELARRGKVKFKSADQLLSEITDLDELILAKPATFINNSGVAVAKLLRKYSLTPADILVVHDDVDTPVGKIRFREQGSSGGHNGLKSIIETIGENFPRLKVGVGKQEGRDTAEFVLEKLTPDQLEELKTSVIEAADRIEKWDF